MIGTEIGAPKYICWTRKKWPLAKEYKRPLEAENGKERDCPLRASREGTSPADPLTLA